MKVRTKTRSGTAPSLLQPLAPRPLRPSAPVEPSPRARAGFDSWIETGF
jgi:hypothetical protein